MTTVKLYKTKVCPYCKMEAEYLREKSVDFEEIYVDSDPKLAEQMMESSGQMGVPFTHITGDNGEHKIVGFDKGKIDAALGLS